MGEGGTEAGNTSGTPSGHVRPSDRDEFYTVSEAARVLGISTRRVRGLASEGRIEGERTEAGWKLFRWSVHSFRDARRGRSGSASAGEAAISPAEAREERERVEALQRELGRLEGRLEIEAVARSTLEESLRRERERADRLEAELAEARSMGFWRRLFGG